VIMVNVGTNDILNGNYQFINTVKKLLFKLINNFLKPKTLSNTFFPMELRHMSEDTISNLNSHIETFAMQTDCCFLDTHRRFSDSDQLLFQADGVHITEAAYEIWAKALLEHIAFLIEND